MSPLELSNLNCKWVNGLKLTIDFIIQGPLLRLEVEGSGFLYRQVRNMVNHISYQDFPIQMRSVFGRSI